VIVLTIIFPVTNWAHFVATALVESKKSAARTLVLVDARRFDDVHEHH